MRRSRGIFMRAMWFTGWRIVDAGNLHSNMPTAVPIGPAVAVADPARQTALLSGELDQKISQQNLLLQATTEQNDRLSVEINKLQEELSKAREVAQKFEELNQRLAARDEELQQARSRLDELEKRSKPSGPKPSETSRSWWKFWS
jgi:septal ring factor EnvC (AmiA/AmiB activator)